MRLITTIEDPDEARILECPELPATAPPLGGAPSAPEDLVWPTDDGVFEHPPDHGEA